MNCINFEQLLAITQIRLAFLNTDKGREAVSSKSKNEISSAKIDIVQKKML